MWHLYYIIIFKLSCISHMSEYEKYRIQRLSKETEEDNHSAHFSSRMDNLSDRNLAFKTSSQDQQIKLLQTQL